MRIQYMFSNLMHNGLKDTLPHRVLLSVITMGLLAILLPGCGGAGGGSLGPTSPVTEGVRSGDMPAQNDVISVPATNESSADYGTWLGTPTSASYAEKFTWVTPFPGDGELIQTRQSGMPPSGIIILFNPTFVNPKSRYVNAIPHEQAKANGWMLTDDAMGEFRLIDPASPGYAEAWADAAIARAREFNSSYIMVDSVDCTLDWYKIKQNRYANDAQWQKALETFLSVVSDKFHAAGMKMCINLGTGWANSWLTPTAKKLMAKCDSAAKEAFVLRTGDGQWGVYHEPSIIDMQIQDVQGCGRKVLCVLACDQKDPAYDEKVRFGLAAYLICRKPGDVFVLNNNTDRPSKGTFWHSDMEIARKLGAIRSAPRKIGNIWVRSYERGTILLNATDKTLDIPDGVVAGSSAGTIAPRTGTVIPKSGS